MAEILEYDEEDDIEINQENDSSDAQKLVWEKESILILLQEYLKRKDAFAAAKGLQEKRLLWEQVRKAIHDAGFSSITTKHIIKKFCLMRRVYKEFRQGLAVGQRLYGFLELLGEILDDDPYICQAKPTKRMMQTINRKLLRNILNGTVCEDDEELVTSLPRWVTYMVKRFEEEESARRKERWKLADEVIALEKKKMDCLESVILTLKGSNSESVKLQSNTAGRKRKLVTTSKHVSISSSLVSTVKPKILRRSSMMDVDGSSEAVELTLANDSDGRLVGRLADGEVYQVEGYFEDNPGIDLQALVAASGIIFHDVAP